MRNELLDKDESEAFSRYLQRRGNRVHRPRLVTSSFSIQVEISLCVTITSGRLTNDRKIRFICAACLLFKTEENMNTPRSEDAYAFPGSRCFWEPITNCDQFRALVSLLAIPNMKSFGKRSGLRCTAWFGGPLSPHRRGRQDRHRAALFAHESSSFAYRLPQRVGHWELAYKRNDCKSDLTSYSHGSSCNLFHFDKVRHAYSNNGSNDAVCHNHVK